MSLRLFSLRSPDEYPIAAAILALVIVSLFSRPEKEVFADDVSKTSQGRLFLVGMGPGDPDLITLRAVSVLENADDVICFPYIEDNVRGFVKRGKLTVASPLLMARWVRLNPDDLEGERREKALQSREEQTKFLNHVRELVQSGHTVAIADAGDTTIFCPWLWTLSRLDGIQATIVPAVSSFNAANAVFAADVIGRNSAVLLSCGQELGSPNQQGRLETTLVFFAHIVKFPDLIQSLLARYPADTPIAIVSDAGYVKKEQVIRGELGTILSTAPPESLPPLHLVYVGDGLLPAKDAASLCPCGKEKP